MNNFQNLIIVPGHASFKEAVSIPLPSDFEDDKYWALQEFQKGEPPYYVEHIKRGLDLLDSSSLLLFSGGRTRLESGQIWSEAKTYNEIAKRFPGYDEERIEIEEFARDSFQNIEYSLRKFKAITGHAPMRTTVVGWGFKEERFKLHAKTLRILNENFSYISANNPDEPVLSNALVGEQKAVQSFLVTPRGDSGTLLEKRALRDPWDDGAPQDY